jgi:hypothetical protein
MLTQIKIAVAVATIFGTASAALAAEHPSNMTLCAAAARHVPVTP